MHRAFKAQDVREEVLLGQMREKDNMKLSKMFRRTCHLSVMELSLFHKPGCPENSTHEKLKRADQRPHGQEIRPNHGREVQLDQRAKMTIN
jgi:hypothetical protein